jgi:hypothetical protein
LPGKRERSVIAQRSTPLSVDAEERRRSFTEATVAVW